MSMPFNIHEILSRLALTRPIFHSEADFQLAFAWTLLQQYPNAKVRLEYRINVPPRDTYSSEAFYIDVWAVLPEETLAIELKYLTGTLTVDIDGEAFSLANHAAQNQRSYDFIKDIVRLERVTDHRPSVRGISCVLTNDTSYQRQANQNHTYARDAFRIYQGRSLSGRLMWPDGTNQKGRNEVLHLRGTYELDWHKYSKVGNIRGGEFHFLSVEVARRAGDL